MTQKRSPVLGYNHNIIHLGWALHIQTEDSGVQNPHIFTHLFHSGTILASKKLVYDVTSAPEFVRDLMQAQHKAVLREVKNGLHDDHIHKMLGPSPASSGKTEAPPAAEAPPQSAASAADAPLPPAEPAPPAAPPLPEGHAASWADALSLTPPVMDSRTSEMLNSTQLEWNTTPSPAAAVTPPSTSPRAPTPPPPATPPSTSVRAPTPPPPPVKLQAIDARASEPAPQPVTTPSPAARAPSSPMFTAPPIPPAAAALTPPSTGERAPTPAPDTSGHPVDVGSSWILRGKIREEVYPSSSSNARQDSRKEPVSLLPTRRATTGSIKAVTARGPPGTSSFTARSELTVTYPDGQELVADYFSSGEAGGLTLENAMELQLGQEILVRLRVESLGNMGFDLRAKVAWKRVRSAGALRAGVGVEFLSSEKAVVERLLSLCRGADKAASDRRHARVIAELAIKLTHKTATRKEKAGDISEGGLFIRTDDLLAIGEEVTVTMKPPRAILGGFDVRGRITWHRDETPKGMGVMFMFDTPAQKTRLEQLITKLAD